MAFPVTPTKVRVDLQINGTWTDVTSYVQTTEGITINRGRTDEAASAQASSCTLTLNNRDGRFTPANPVGAYYPNLTRNTPIRVGVGVPPSGAGLGNQAATVSPVAPATVAEQSGIALALWALAAPTAAITMPAGYTAAGVGLNGGYTASRAGYAGVSAGPVAAAVATSSVSGLAAGVQVVIPGVSGFSFLSPTSTSGSASLTPLNPAVSGPFTVAAGDVLVVMGVWSQDPLNAMVCAPQDSSAASEWQLVADSGISMTSTAPRAQIWTRYCPVAATISTVQFVNWLNGYGDVQLVAGQLTGAAPWNPRFTGTCSSLTTTADLSGRDVRCSVEAGAILRQRGQGTQPAHSAPYRQLSTSSPLVYWPLEGGPSTKALTSPIPGVAQAAFAPGPLVTYTPGADSTNYIFSDPLGQVTATYVYGAVPAYSTSAQLSGIVYGAFRPDPTEAAPALGGGGMLMARCSGAAGKAHAIFLKYISATTVGLFVMDETNAVLGSTSVLLPSSGAPFWFLVWVPNAANPATQTDFQLAQVDINTGTLLSSSPVTITTTVGPITAVSVGQEPTNTIFFQKPATVGHLAAYTGSIPGSSIIVGLGWNGESMSERLVRICQEESIPLATTPVSSTPYGTAPNAGGFQSPMGALDIINQIQQTDGGELAEARGIPGLLYRPTSAMSGIPVAATVDYAARMIAGTFEPVDDDQITRNDISVNQQNGGTAEAVQLTGPLSILNPPAGVGTYTASIDINVFAQARDMPLLAQWYLAQGTVTDQRFKNVTSLLEAVPASVTALSAIDVGQRVQITNTPAWVQPGPSDVIVLGLTETIGPVADWEITFNARPYGVNAVLRADSGDAMARLDSGSSAIQTGASAGATSLVVQTALAGDLWSSANCPFDIRVAGERMTVTAIAGSTSPQTFTVTRAVNGVSKAQVAGSAVDVFWQNHAGWLGTF